MKNTRTMKNNKWAKPLMGAGIIIVIVLAILQFTHVIHLFGKQSVPVTASQSTKGEPAPTTSQGTTQNSGSTQTTTQPGDQKSETGGTTVANLIAPTGDFVSNHAPGQNGTPATEVSVCNTTPGATCQILFVKGSEVQSLPAQITDRGGSTYWNNWTPESIGLSAGSWQIKAVATLGDQTKTSTDVTSLVVQ